MGEEKDLYKDTFSATLPLWYIDYTAPISAYVKIRYTHKETKAYIFQNKEKIVVKFYKKQKAITKGQLAVFYDDDLVIGSAWID